MKKTELLQLLVATALFLMGGLSTSTAQIVYQDNFDNDGLTINNGAGGGGINTSFNFNNGPEWMDDGDLAAGAAGTGAHIWVFSSDNTFTVAGGFTLEVEFDQMFIDNNGDNTTAPFNANHLSIGLSTPNTNGNLFLSTNGAVPETEGIGVSLTERNGDVDIGVLEQDFSAGTTTTLDPITSPTE